MFDLHVHRRVTILIMGYRSDREVRWCYIERNGCAEP